MNQQQLSYIVQPIWFPRLGNLRDPFMWHSESLKKSMPEVRQKEVLPRELPRLRASALTDGKQYGSVLDVLQVAYGQDFGAILKNYVDNHLEELHKNGILQDSLFIRFGGIGTPYVETNYEQPSKDFFLDVVADCLLEGEHFPQCVTFYIRYKLCFCVINPRCFLWEVGLYRNDPNDELRDTSLTKADGSLLPKITAAMYDETVDRLLENYNSEALKAPCPVDVYRIAAGLGLRVNEILIPDRDILGQMHFWPGTVEHVGESGALVVSRVKAMDVLINRLSCRTMISRRSSLGHEIGHSLWSRMFELLQIMAGNKHRAVVNKRKTHPKDSSIPRELEAQASKFSGHLLLPRRTALPFVEEEVRKLGGHATPRQMEAIVSKVMDTFQVSRQMATLRLRDFGYDVVKGVNRYLDGHYVPAYGTSSGEWKSGVDYTIEHKAVFELYFGDSDFRQVINTGRFVFVENHLCLADKRYIAMDIVQSAGVRSAHLTEYARNHIDECCLAFREHATTSHRFYDGILNREICNYVKDYRFDASRTPGENAQAMVEYAEITQHLPQGFGEALKYHMKRVKVTTEKLAEALEISDRLLYDYQRPIPPASLGPGEPDSSKKAKTAPKRPTKKTVVTMALLMHLMPDWSRHLLNQASYVLDPAQREELAWLCAIQTCYMCEIEQINLQFRQLGLTALTSRFPEDSAA